MTPFDPYPNPEIVDGRWPTWKAEIERLAVVAHPVEFGVFRGLVNFPLIKVTIRVSLPANGPVYAVNEEETIFLVVPGTYPRTPPKVIAARADFPRVPHLMRHSEEFALFEFCLTRGPRADWWVGRTFTDVVLRMKRWLDDAAGGLLVKETDPYEPLWLSDPGGVIELQCDPAREETMQHGGTWMTKGRKDRENPRRIFVGEGDIPTVVFYQPEPQSYPWLEPPHSIEELALLAQQHGIEQNKFTYWVEGRNNAAEVVFVLLGVRRTKEVLGKTGEDEWVGFELRRERRGQRSRRSEVRWTSWEVIPYYVRECLTPTFARRLGGLRTKTPVRKVLLVGAGAFGSIFGDVLARSGLVKLMIVDPDDLVPHNLTRHALNGTSVGHNKAQALARSLNSLFPGQPIADGNPRDLTSYTSEEIAEMLAGYDCVVDCSASPAVQVFLSELAIPVPPIVCAFQVSGGRGSVLIRTTEQIKEGGLTPEMIESVLASSYRTTPVIAEWLGETVEPIQIGGGCRSISARIPDSLVRQGAAWAADNVLRWLSEDSWPSTAGYAINVNSFDEISHVTTSWHPIGPGKLHIKGEWRIWLSASVCENIGRQTATGHGETGGLLIGQVDRQRKLIFVNNAWEPPADSRGGPASFKRGIHLLIPQLAVLESDTGDRLRYVGERVPIMTWPKAADWFPTIAAPLNRERLVMHHRSLANFLHSSPTVTRD